MENEEKDSENLSKGMGPFKDSFENYPNDLNEDQKEVCYDICKRMYIIRHYSMDMDNMNIQLRRLDRVLGDRGYNN